MNILKSFFVVLLLFFSSITACAQQAYPSAVGYVNDYAGVLSPAEKQQIESVCRGLKQQTGAEMAVAIVKSVEPLDPKTYAVELFESWKLGEKGKDNGVLILLTMEEKRIEIEVGYGLEGALPDAMVGRILDTFAVPNFKQGKMGEGLAQTAQAVGKVVAGEEVKLAAPQEAQRPPSEQDGISTGVIIFIIIAIIILGVITRRAGSIPFGIIGALWGGENAGLAGAIAGALVGFFFGFWGMMFFGGGRGFGGGSFRGGGFGGFGGGRSGGGGAGRSW